jgi:hypothetical protein
MKYGDGHPVNPDDFFQGYSAATRGAARKRGIVDAGPGEKKSAECPQTPINAYPSGIFDYIGHFCRMIRESVARKKDVQAADPFFPISQKVFEDKVSQMLNIWKLRRNSFERAWAELQKTKYQIETECKKLRENPIMARFMDGYRRANDDHARERCLAELKKNMEDKYSDYAGSLRLSIENLERGIFQLRRDAKISYEAASADPLVRMGCPEAVENDVKNFVAGILNRPEMEFARDEKNDDLRGKIAGLAEDLARMFAELKASMFSIFRGDSTETEVSGPGMRAQ